MKFMRSGKGAFANLAALFMMFAALSCTAQTKSSEPAKAESETVKSEVIHLTTAEFKEKVFDYTVNKEWKYNGSVPAILDFHAVWCGPCKMLSPHLKALQEEYGEKIQVYKIDVDKEREVASAFGIRSMPTLIFIPMEGQPTGVTGYRDKNALEKMVNEVLKVEKEVAAK